jgi:benzoyl-CoA 2,3-dioxygenase component B
MSIDTTSKIPNNVNLADDRALNRALEHWLPNYLAWWNEMGPDGTQGFDVYLRTAVSVEPSGWAHFDHVKMPDYRWGIFLAPQVAERKIHFGEHIGEPAWQEVPGEHRAKPSPHHRHARATPSPRPSTATTPRPDLPVALRLAQPLPGQRRGRPPPVGDGVPPHRYFGRDGREEADALLERRSGRHRQPANPRRLQREDARLARVLHVHVLHRPRRQVPAHALAESGFDPLARTTRFMLTEEAHHMFVGESGRGAHPAAHGRGHEGARQPTIREAARRRRDRPADHPALSQLPLLGDDRPLRRRPVVERGDVLRRGLKGRFEEGKRADDHRLHDATYACSRSPTASSSRSRRRCSMR